MLHRILSVPQTTVLEEEFHKTTNIRRRNNPYRNWSGVCFGYELNKCAIVVNILRNAKSIGKDTKVNHL